MQTNEPQTPPSSQNASSQPAGQEAKALAAELEQLRARLAELENQRRRLHRDLEQARRFANEKLLGDLLPVYDNLERGLAAEGSDIAALREGIELTLKAMLKVAESHGLRPIDPLGEPLDPEKHHAVSMVEAPDQKPGTVVNVLQKGYVLNDRLVRPALVAVAKEP